MLGLTTWFKRLVATPQIVYLPNSAVDASVFLSTGVNSAYTAGPI